MKRKKFIAVVAMTVGAVIFAGSAFANYSNASGYTAGKEAVKNFLQQDNYTVNVTLSMNIDGNEIENGKFTELVDKNGDVKLNSFTENEDYSSREYYQDGVRIVESTYPSSGTRTTVYDDGDSYIGYTFSPENEDDEEMVNKAIHFGELVCDLIVGDLKNNVILIDSTDGIDTYAISLENYQIPEVINAGLSLIMGQNSRYIDTENMTDEEMENYMDNPDYLFGEDTIIDKVEGTVGVDSEGRLASISGTVSVSGTDLKGNAHTVGISLDGTVTDYGTTTPTRIDMSNLKGSVNYTSSWRKDRINEIDEMLEEDDIKEEVREDLENEKASLAKEESENEKTAVVIGGEDVQTQISVD